MLGLGKVFVRVSYLVAAFFFAASIVMTLQGRLWVSQLGDLSSVGLGSICVLYVLSHHRFSKAGVDVGKSVVLAILFANAFLQSYEIIYGLSFGIASICCDPPSIAGSDLRTAILWVVMISPLVLVRGYLRFKWTSLVLIVSFATVWVVWVLYGFPQYYFAGYPFPNILKTDDPFHVSLWFNFGSKVILAAFFASLLEPLVGLPALFRRENALGSH